MATPDMGKRELHQPPPAAEGATEPGVRNMLVVVGGVEEIGIGLTTSLKKWRVQKKGPNSKRKSPSPTPREWEGGVGVCQAARLDPSSRSPERFDGGLLTFKGQEISCKCVDMSFDVGIGASMIIFETATLRNRVGTLVN
jgi:hypothetical protein